MVDWQSAFRAISGLCSHLIKQLRLKSFRRFMALFLISASLSTTIAACSVGKANQPQDVELTLVSFAVTRAAYKAIIPKFVEQWQQTHHQHVTIAQSYGGSGAQARAVIDGLDADVVHLALSLDVDRISKAGLIYSGWQKEFPNQGIVSKSVAALVTRAGNPKGIKTWADLTKDGVSLITADPKTSGVARWNFLALWNAAMQSTHNQAKAEEFITQVYKNAPILARDAREATDAFYKQGQGDALINYENEILLAAQHGEQLPFTIPDVNISIDNPIAVVDKNVDAHGNRQVAEAFVQFLFTPEAQREFVKAGFRPINSAIAEVKSLAAQYPTVKNLGTVQEYGGWNQVQKEFFADGAFFDQMQAQLRNTDKSS